MVLNAHRNQTKLIRDGEKGLWGGAGAGARGGGGGWRDFMMCPTGLYACLACNLHTSASTRSCAMSLIREYYNLGGL